MTIDPERQFPSPYVGFGNNPINGIDTDGKRYYPVNTVLKFYGIGSRESIVFTPISILEKSFAAVKTFFGIIDPTSPVELTIALETYEYLEAFQHNAMTSGFEYKLQHANLKYSNLINYRETLSNVETIITDKISVLEVQIDELKERNINCNCNFNSEEITDLTNQLWDLEYQLVPIEQDQKLIDTTIEERFNVLQQSGSN